MAIFTRQALRELVERPDGLGLSIYMPTHRFQDTPEDSIRLKNLLRDAEQKLVNNGLRSPDAKQYTAPAAVWITDAQFWQHQSDGLAIFSAPGFYRQFRLPYAFPELVYAGPRFHVKPLIHFLTGNGLFYILAASQRRVRLLQCTATLVREVTPDNVPPNIDEAMKFDSHEKNLQQHTLGGGTRGMKTMVQGASSNARDTKNEIIRYFEQINRAIEKVLVNEDAPVIFAGDDFLESIFRRNLHYRQVMDKFIPGNPDIVSDDALQKQGWAIMKPFFDSDRQYALDRYCAATAHGNATNDLKEALTAANQGRVGYLFVAVGTERWGKFDLNEMKMEVHESAQPGDVDLLDQAAVTTMLHDGKVFPVPKEQIPGVPPIAALYRF